MELNYEDEKVWDLIKSGRTKGVFQLETSLGKGWAKKCQPSSVEELSDLIAILRPGVLKSNFEGKSLAQHYADRKMGVDQVSYIHESLSPILSSSYGILCVEEDTFISESSGLETQIKNLLPKTQLQTVNSKNYIESNECSNVCKSRVDEGFLLRLANGFSVILTKDHKVLTHEGMKELQNLDLKEDVVAVAVKQNNRKQPIDSGPFDDIKFAYLLGQYMGDGCGGLCIAVGKESYGKILEKFVQDNFPGLITKVRFNVRCWYLDIHDSIYAKLPKPHQRKTRLNNLLDKYGARKTKLNKVIPSQIYQSSKEVISSYLAGLFDSDGHCKFGDKKDVISFCSVNPNSINGTRKLLSILEIPSFIDKNLTHIYPVDHVKFANTVGKYTIFKNLEKSYRTGITYGDYPLYIAKDKIKNTGISYKKYCRQNKITSCTILTTKKKLININTAIKCGVDNLDRDISYMSIKSIESVGIKNFYSISVEKNHNFIGNGIVLSNCHQEQIIRIAQDIAGYSESDADQLRKIVAKKEAEKFAAARIKFVEGCEKTGIVNKDVSTQIFDWIDKCSRYSFNKSHSISYALNAYESAYYKLYNTHKFFEVYLNHSKKDQNEIKELVNDAKFFGIETYPPRLKYLYPKFTNIGNSIYFGLTLVKDVGETECNKMMDLIAEAEKKISKKKEEWGWFDLLVNIFGNINKKVITALTSVGAFNGENNRVTRNRMIYEYGVWSKLPEGVTNWITENYRNYEGDRLEILVRAAVNNVKINSRSLSKVMDLLTMLGSPPYDLEDTPDSISDMEEIFLGVSLTCSKTDAKGVYSVNSTCKDVDLGKIPSKPVLCVKIDEFREWKTKNDSIMVFLKVEDSTGMLDVVMFEEQYNEHRNLIRKGNIVLIVCEQSKKKKGLIVKDLHQM